MTYTAELLKKAEKIRLILSDVDGVMTDGRLYYSPDGETLKVFHVKDGLGIKLVQQHGIEFGIISGRQSQQVERRCQELGIRHLYQGQEHKEQVYRELLALLHLAPEQVAYIGDDWPDVPLIRRSGLGVAVADALPWVRQQADWITQTPGGLGAVRELCELVLVAQQHLTVAQHAYQGSA